MPKPFVNCVFWSMPSGKDKEVAHNHVCFGVISQHKMDYVRFRLKIEETVTDEQVFYWLEFCREMLQSKEFTYEPIQQPKDYPGKRTIDIWYPCKGEPWGRTLVNLTAFRYPQEQPAMMLRAIGDMTKDKETVFTDLQKAHEEYRSGALKELYSTMDCHILCNRRSFRYFLTLQELWAKLAGGPHVYSPVHNYFVKKGDEQ